MKSIFLLLVITMRVQLQVIEHWQSEPVLNSMLKQQTSLNFGPNLGSNPWTITVNELNTYQQMDGFGASLTDSSAWLLKYKLTDLKRKEVLESLFGASGIKMSLLRQPLGSSDFSWESWTFADTSNNKDDFNLDSFAMWREDDYIRPMLNLSLAVIKGRIKLFASPWSNNFCLSFHIYLTTIRILFDYF
jgi:glucosylceramidase